jgi:hypothetical protein
MKKKIIKLNENDIENLVKKIIKEDRTDFEKVYVIVNREMHGYEAVENVYKTLEDAVKDDIFDRYEETPEILNDSKDGGLYGMSETFYILPFKIN